MTGRKEGRWGECKGQFCTSRKEENFGTTALQRVYNSVAIKSWYPILFSFGSEACLLLCFQKFLKKNLGIHSMAWSYNGWSGQGWKKRAQHSLHAYSLSLLRTGKMTQSLPFGQRFMTLLTPSPVIFSGWTSPNFDLKFVICTKDFSWEMGDIFLRKKLYSKFPGFNMKVLVG